MNRENTSQNKAKIQKKDHSVLGDSCRRRALSQLLPNTAISLLLHAWKRSDLTKIVGVIVTVVFLFLLSGKHPQIFGEVYHTATVVEFK